MESPRFNQDLNVSLSYVQQDKFNNFLMFGGINDQRCSSYVIDTPVIKRKKNLRQIISKKFKKLINIGKSNQSMVQSDEKEDNENGFKTPKSIKRLATKLKNSATKLGKRKSLVFDDTDPTPEYCQAKLVNFNYNSSFYFATVNQIGQPDKVYQEEDSTQVINSTQMNVQIKKAKLSNLSRINNERSNSCSSCESSFIEDKISQTSTPNIHKQSNWNSYVINKFNDNSNVSLNCIPQWAQSTNLLVAIVNQIYFNPEANGVFIH